MSGRAARERLLAELAVVSRRHMAAYVLLNQAVADRLGLHPTDLQCLNLLTLEGRPVTTGRIAGLTGLSTGAATRLVDRLERAGYVVREGDPADRRRVLVSAVPERADAFRRAWDGVGGNWVALFDDLDDDRLAGFVELLGRASDFAATRAARLRSGEG
ncbi:MarR family winged helix-turn-helix transcriptional regulator [Streptomyces sp. bgisy022]|uniref:MarR family winged helix-turn-helix transcriptional regulator n=1 Tax=Streptomyces sp. bgisy022 TaxID=3413769 RepID=UPI003D7642FC